jgi:hypothetical protein
MTSDGERFSRWKNVHVQPVFRNIDSDENRTYLSRPCHHDPSLQMRALGPRDCAGWLMRNRRGAMLHCGLQALRGVGLPSATSVARQNMPGNRKIQGVGSEHYAASLVTSAMLARAWVGVL